MSKTKDIIRKIFRSYIWLFVVIFVLDIASKWAVQNSLKVEGNNVEVIKDFFYITLSHNTGSAFSLGADNIAMRVIFIIISWGMSVAISIYYLKHYKKDDVLLNAVYAMLLAGAMGNMIDRTFYWPNTVGFSGVIDFLQFYIFGRSNNPFATFNVADASLVIGIIMAIVIIIVRTIKEQVGKSKEEQAEKDGVTINDGQDNNN